MMLQWQGELRTRLVFFFFARVKKIYPDRVLAIVPAKIERVRK